MIVAGAEPFRVEDEAILGQLAQLLAGALQNRLLIDRARAAESHFRILFERNPNPMWVYDRETLRFLEVNDAAIELYGWSREQFREMTVLDLRSRDDVPRLLETLKEMGQTLRHHGEWRHLTRDGRDLDVLVAAYYGVEHEGRPVGLTVVHDISERKRVEQALAESEARFRNIADTIPGMLWVTDADGKAIFVNRQWREYTGCVREEDAAAGWENYLHPEDIEGVLASVNAAAELRRPFSVNYRLRRHDGEYRWFLDTGSPRVAPDGSLLGYIGAALDITDQRRMEGELRQAQKMQAVGQLTGGIAHDFNNLLTVILGNSELIAAEAANDPYLSQLSEMTRKAADRGAGLVRRLLAFSRRQTLQPQVTDINRLIADMNDMLLRALGEDVDVAFALSDNLWPACIDPEQLETALLNLAINARDAISEGGRLVIETANLMVTGSTVASDEPVPPGDYLAISVTDNGTGMAPEVLARAFEPFFTTKEVGRGTGLGLSMVYGFVKQSDGYVSLSSEPGAGTTVKILLPRAAIDAEVIAAAGSVGPAPSGSGQTILLVEDEPLVRSMLVEQLKRLGYGVVEAPNGPSALALLDEREDIDLLLTDMVMPAGMNGRQLAEAAMTLRPELRFLFMSGHTDDRLAHQGQLPGGQPLLRKPVSKKVLAEALRAALAAEAA
jgi:PAS domain S-box-containing protein